MPRGRPRKVVDTPKTGPAQPDAPETQGRRPYVDPRYIKTPAQQKARMVEDFLIYAIGQRAVREGTLGLGAKALLRNGPPHEGFEDCPLESGSAIRQYFKIKFGQEKPTPRSDEVGV